MNGDALTILVAVAAVLVAVVATGLTLTAMSHKHGVRLGRMEEGVEALGSVWTHVGDHEHRLTVMETEHKNCPVCKQNGKSGGG